MNKDEMIEEMAKIANFSAFDYKQGTIQSKTIYTAMAEALYNANCRIIADDEIVESMKTYERARQETAREILQKLKDNIMLADFGCGDGYEEVVDINTDELKKLANEYGIELED